MVERLTLCFFLIDGLHTLFIFKIVWILDNLGSGQVG